MPKNHKANVETSGVIPVEDGTYAVLVESCDANGETSSWTETFDDEASAFRYCQQIDKDSWPRLLAELES